MSIEPGSWDDESVDMALASIARNPHALQNTIENLANIADYFMVEVIDHLELTGEDERADYISHLHDQLRGLFPLNPTPEEQS